MVAHVANPESARPELSVSGSNDDSLAAQLKALYVKQEFSRFAQETQDLPAPQLKLAYTAFMQRIKPRDVNAPTWTAGVTNAAL